MSKLQVETQIRRLFPRELKQAFADCILITESPSDHNIFCSFNDSLITLFQEVGLEVIYCNPSCFEHPLHHLSNQDILDSSLFNYGYHFPTTTLGLFPHFSDAQVLFGHFCEQTMQFSVINTGLDYFESTHVLVTITRNVNLPQRALAIERIAQYTLYYKTATIEHDQATEILIFNKKDMAFTRNGNRKHYASRWVTHAVEEQHEKLAKMLCYECVNDGLNIWDAWVLDASGIELAPDEIYQPDPQRPQIYTKCWYDLHPDYLCATCYRYPSGEIELACRRVSKGSLTKMQYLHLNAIRELIVEAYADEEVPEWINIPNY